MQKTRPNLPGRLLCTICASYTAGICIFASFHPSVVIISIICILALAVIKFKKLPYFLTTLIICVSFCGGLLHFSAKEAADRRFINRYSGRYLTLTGNITDISYVDGGFQNITAHVDSLTCLGTTEKADFDASIFTDCEKTFAIGDIITFSDILNPDKKAFSHSFDNEKYLRSKGIYASFDPSTNYITPSGNSPGFSSRLRLFSLALSQKLQTLVGGDEGGFVSAITLGDTSALSDSLSDSFRKSGISHIVAVSGMHLAILMSFFFFLAGHSRLHFKIRNGFGILIVIAYMILTGMSPSVTRAGIMLICFLSSALVDRKEDAATSFFLSAAIILVFNPYTIFSASFLLSYLSLAGIILFSGHFRRLIGKLSFLPDFITEISASTAASWLFTLPALTIMFGGISLVSLPANIMVLPFINLIFILSLAVLATGFFAPLAQFLALAVKLLVKVVIFCANAVASLPFSHINLPAPGLADILVFALFVLLLYLILNGRKPGKSGIAAMLAAICYISFSLTSSVLTYTVTFLDIGQGDCILIKAPGLRHYLIDTGPYASTTLSALRSCGVNRLEAIFLSHSDKDHSGALAEIIREIPTGKLILPHYNVRSGETTAIVSDCLSAGTDVEFARQQYKYDFSGMVADILWPARTGYGSGDENSNSLVMSVDIKDNKFLFTGDIDSGAENDIIKSGADVDADVLKSAHHGSGDSSSDSFLLKVSPEFAVICVGNGNPYGHPHEETLARLENSGSKVLRTDQMGDIKFTIDLFGNMRVDYETK